MNIGKIKLIKLSFISVVLIFPFILLSQEKSPSFSTSISLGSEIKNLESPYMQFGIGINNSPDKMFYFGFDLLLGSIREKYTLYSHNDYSYTTTRFSLGIGSEYSPFIKFKLRPSFGVYIVYNMFEQRLSTNDEFIESVIRNSVSRNSVNLAFVISHRYTFKPKNSVFIRYTLRLEEEPLIHPNILTFGYEKLF